MSKNSFLLNSVTHLEMSMPHRLTLNKMTHKEIEVILSPPSFPHKTALWAPEELRVGSGARGPPDMEAQQWLAYWGTASLEKQQK